MIETHLNIFDCVVIGVMALSCIIAFFRGLVKEVLSLVAWIGAGIITGVYYQPTLEHAKEYFKSAAVAAAASAIGLYIVALLGVAILNLVIVITIKQGGEAGMLDNTLGLVFGAFRGAFIISLGFFMITIALPEGDYPDWIAESVTHPYAEKGAMILTRLAPEYMSRASSLQQKAIAQAKEHIRDGEIEEEGLGYGNRTTRQLDRMLEDSESGPTR